MSASSDSTAASSSGANCGSAMPAMAESNVLRHDLHVSLLDRGDRITQEVAITDAGRDLTERHRRLAYAIQIAARTCNLADQRHQRLGIIQTTDRFENVKPNFEIFFPYELGQDAVNDRRLIQRLYDQQHIPSNARRALAKKDKQRILHATCWAKALVSDPGSNKR